jgi:hypothetical protein
MGDPLCHDDQGCERLFADPRARPALLHVQ